MSLDEESRPVFPACVDQAGSDAESDRPSSDDEMVDGGGGSSEGIQLSKDVIT